MILAPLAGITDKAFRSICFRCGAEKAYTEMVSVKGLHYKSEATEELLSIGEDEGPVGIQLFGHDPELFEEAGRKLADRDNAFFDINMGCPVPKVVKNHEGSYLLKTPEVAADCVRALAAAQGKPVTVKIRAGFSEANYDELAKFARLMESAGAAAIAVHGRTREQYYSGAADWQAIRVVKESVAIPVIGNGDVFRAEDAERMKEQTGCDEVMVARGALGNPWIFQGRSPSDEERCSMIKEHLAALIEYKGEYVALREMRKHASWYTKGMPDSADFRREINSTRTYEEFNNTLDKLFGR